MTAKCSLSPCLKESKERYQAMPVKDIIDRPQGSHLKREITQGLAR